MVADVEVAEALLSSIIKTSNAAIRAVATAKDATETPPKLTPTSPFAMNKKERKNLWGKSLEILSNFL